MDDAIGALAHLSLVDFHPDKRTFSVHRLVQAAARDALGEDAPAWLRSALRAVHSAFPVPEFRTWPLCERLVAHVRAVAAQVTEDSGELAWLLGTTGDYLRERAALAEVLPLYERTRAIFERLAQADPDNTGWQRDLSVSFNKIGDVQRARGDLDAALEAYQDRPRHRREAGRAGPEQQRVAARPLGQLHQDRRRAARAGRSRRRAQGLSEEPRHLREAGRAGPEQHRVAARPLGQLPQDRRRAERAGRAGRRAEGLSEQPRDRREAGGAGPEQRPVAARPLGISNERDRQRVHDARGSLDEALTCLSSADFDYQRQLAAQDPSNTGGSTISDQLRTDRRRADARKGNLDAALEAYEDSLGSSPRSWPRRT